MNIIFSIVGGIGKCIAATAVCEAIKKKFPNDHLIVVSGYAEVFLNNPFVDTSLAHGNTPYFYRDFIEGQDVVSLLHDPYQDQAYLQQDEHLIKTWCEMFDIPYKGEQPSLYFTKREKEFFAQKFVSDKPIFVMQTNGGAPGQPVKYSWARDIPQSVCVKIVEHFKNDYNIVHLRREDQPALEFTTPVTASNFREAAILLSISQKRLLIDSFAQHTAAALNLPSTVCWIVNKPEVFGYKLHDNILPNSFTKKPELRNSFLVPFNIVGDPVEFPYNSEDEIFDVEKIIKSLDTRTSTAPVINRLKSVGGRKKSK